MCGVSIASILGLFYSPGNEALKPSGLGQKREFNVTLFLSFSHPVLP
jgi:hypothetical protein